MEIVLRSQTAEAKRETERMTTALLQFAAETQQAQKRGFLAGEVCVLPQATKPENPRSPRLCGENQPPSSAPSVSSLRGLCVRISPPSRASFPVLSFMSVFLAAGCPRAEPPPHAAAATTPRIVSLAPNLTEIVCAVGAADRLVGRTEVCNYPSNLLANVPVVGGFGRPYLEPMLAQKPTLVLDVALEDKSLAAALERLGIGRRHIACRRLDDIPCAVRTIGRLAGRIDAAGTLAGSIESGIRNRREAIGNVPLGRRPLVYVEIWGEPLMTVGKDSFVSELVELAGGRNLGDELALDYGTVSTEWVLTRNPEIILCLYPSVDHHASKTVAARLGWQTLRAVQNSRVYDTFSLDTILRPGPRVLDGAEQLRLAIAGTNPPLPPMTNAMTGTAK